MQEFFLKTLQLGDWKRTGKKSEPTYSKKEDGNLIELQIYWLVLKDKIHFNVTIRLTVGKVNFIRKKVFENEITPLTSNKPNNTITINKIENIPINRNSDEDPIKYLNENKILIKQTFEKTLIEAKEKLNLSNLYKNFKQRKIRFSHKLLITAKLLGIEIYKQERMEVIAALETQNRLQSREDVLIKKLITYLDDFNVENYLIDTPWLSKTNNKKTKTSPSLETHQIAMLACSRPYSINV